MRYREYRRKCNETKKARARKIACIAQFCPYNCRKIEYEWPVARYADADDADYLVRRGRPHISRILKKQYTRKLRNGKRSNEVYNGSSYKRASGDFWWSIT